VQSTHITTKAWALRWNNHNLIPNKKQENVWLSSYAQIGWSPSSLLLDTNLRFSSSSHVTYIELPHLRTRIFSSCPAEFCRQSLVCLWATFSIVLLALLGGGEALIDEKFKDCVQMYAMTHSEQFPNTIQRH
jgi:hypothetical protein